MPLRFTGQARGQLMAVQPLAVQPPRLKTPFRSLKSSSGPGKHTVTLWNGLGKEFLSE